MKITIKSLAVNLFAVLGAASISLGASGTERPFIIEYTQVTGGTTQSLSGSIVIDDSYLFNPGNEEYYFPSLAFKSLSLTLTGDTLTETYTLDDFDSLVFSTNGATLDLTKELVGQLTSGDPWGTPSDGPGGDFNLFGESPLNGEWWFTLCRIEEGGGCFELTSFRPQVLYSLAQAYSSLMSTNAAIDSALSTTSLLVNGAHSRPMSRRVAKGEKTFWVSGDWGNDDHDSRDGSTGLAEMGFGYNFGPAQINLSLGKTWADQDLIHGGEVDVDGGYLMVESILPVSEEQGLYATLGAYNHWGDVDIRRRYTVGEDTETSTASTDTRTWGLRARLDWENAFSFKSARFSPYTDALYTKTKLDSYTEKSGSFPAHFDSREDDVTELRIGINGAVPIRKIAFEFIANIEGVRRFDDEGDGASGEVVGLFSFDLEEGDYDQNWLKGGVGVEGQLGKGKVSLMLNGTTEGEAPSSWLAASYQVVF